MLPDLEEIVRAARKRELVFTPAATRVDAPVLAPPAAEPGQGGGAASQPDDPQTGWPTKARLRRGGKRLKRGTTESVLLAFEHLNQRKEETAMNGNGRK